ncbi:MAG TPA: FAD:protein FMN transferase, partial [Burkholderiaceae bacterium]|nr:FAD:protein FMN transferase [Burkholderiaceae bacterium]
RWHVREQAGRRWSHTLDPRTGEPVAHALASVTVLHEHCMDADALATVLTVLGIEEGRAFADRHGVAALFARREPDGTLALHPSAAWLAQASV